MTIEEAIKIVECQRADNLTFSGYTHHHVSDALVFIQGYEAKDNELKGATVILKGWIINDCFKNWARMDEQVELFNANTKEDIIGNGKTYHEALQNALKKIEKLKG